MRDTYTRDRRKRVILAKSKISSQYVIPDSDLTKPNPEILQIFRIDSLLGCDDEHVPFLN